MAKLARVLPHPTPHTILAKLEAQGVKLTLRLTPNQKLTEQQTELVRQYQDDLKLHLASNLSGVPQMCRNTEDEIDEAVWCRRCWRHHVSACKPTEHTYAESMAQVRQKKAEEK